MSKKQTAYNPAEHPRTATDRAFRISLYLKGLDGVFEMLGGILLLLVNPAEINHWAVRLTRSELSEDPHDFLANHILKTAYSLTGKALVFGAVYLLAQGVVKVVLVWQVFLDRVWAYLALIVVVGLFAVYQIYRLAAVKFSAGLFLLTLFDLLIIYLTQREYRNHKARLAGR
jgi:uncharacterized membrane protein